MANQIKAQVAGFGDSYWVNTEVVGSGVAGADYPVQSSGIKAAIEAVAPTTPQDYIVLKSSTASSTKKFKITVVDNGTISATEIV